MQGLAVEGERRSQVVPGVVWLQALPALFFRAEQPKIRVLIREGIDRLREESFPAWEEEFQRLEVLQTARMLNVVDPASIFLSGEERLAAPVTASRIRYLQGVMLSWGGDRRAAEREAWRTWAKAGFAEHLKSTDVRLHEAMAKGLAAGHVDRVRDARGGEVDWREKLAVRLFDLQRSDGSWTGEIPRVEGLDEVLENSCRALLALETIVKSL